MTSAGPDRGFHIYTNTFQCLSCFSINDIHVKPGSKSGLDDILPDEECRDCGGKTFGLYDYRNLPCPKCGTELKFDSGAEFYMTNWD